MGLEDGGTGRAAQTEPSEDLPSYVGVTCHIQHHLACSRTASFVPGGVHDQDADSRPWITNTCAASMALKASSSIFIKCHILPKLTLLTTWIVDDLPRQRNLKKLGIKRTWSPGVNYVPRGKLTWQTKKLKVVSCNEIDGHGRW